MLYESVWVVYTVNQCGHADMHTAHLLEWTEEKNCKRIMTKTRAGYLHLPASGRLLPRGLFCSARPISWKPNFTQIDLKKKSLIQTLPGGGTWAVACRAPGRSRRGWRTGKCQGPWWDSGWPRPFLLFPSWQRNPQRAPALGALVALTPRALFESHPANDQTLTKACSARRPGGACQYLFFHLQSFCWGAFQVERTEGANVRDRRGCGN